MERETEQRQDGTCKDRGMHICNTAQSHSPFLCGLIVTAMDSEGAGSDEHVVEVDEAMDVRAAAAAGGQTPSVDARKKTSAVKAVVRTGEDLDWKIKGLKEKQAALKAERKRVKTTLKNAERRRSRLRKRAKLLTDADLVEVLMMRGMEKDEVDKQVEEARSSRDTQ